MANEQGGTSQLHDKDRDPLPDRSGEEHDSDPGRYQDPRSQPKPKPDPTMPPRPRGVDHGVADADKVARTGSSDEQVRDTPPAGAWNDVSGD